MSEEMKESTRKKSAVQDEITALLKTDVQTAMTMMVAEYTALLWRIAEQYLKNPEDIRECVNDTFLQFYVHQDRYSPEKGFLPAFLAAIARNLAIDRYRKNRIRSAGALTEEIPANADDIQNVNEKMDLERALSTLKPEDVEIIRMKYYDGMTVQEIADSLNLPYETVKKRHQRSLSKMRFALLLGLIALVALLAACAYIILHYFEVIPGFGVIDTHGIFVYMLEEPVSAEDSAGIYTVERGYVVDGKILLQGNVHFKSEDSSEWVLPIEPGAPSLIAMFRYDEELCPGLMSWSSWTTRDREFTCGTDLLAFEENQDGIGIALVLNYLEFPLDFGLTGLDSVENYSYEMGEKGGVMAFPHWLDGSLVVDLYPLNVEGYTISSFVGQGFRTWDILNEDAITLIKNEGNKQEGQQENISGIYLPGIVNMESWNFGLVEPGAYLLHIPYLILEQKREESDGIPVNLPDCQWEEKEYQAPGARIRVTDCQSLETVPGEFVSGTSEYAREGLSYWMVTLDYQKVWEGGDDFIVLPCYPCVNCPALKGGTGVEFGYTGYKEGNLYHLIIWAEDGECDTAHAVITSEDRVTLKWEHSFDIPIMVSPDSK